MKSCQVRNIGFVSNKSKPMAIENRNPNWRWRPVFQRIPRGSSFCEKFFMYFLFFSDCQIFFNVLIGAYCIQEKNGFAVLLKFLKIFVSEKRFLCVDGFANAREQIFFGYSEFFCFRRAESKVFICAGRNSANRLAVVGKWDQVFIFKRILFLIVGTPFYFRIKVFKFNGLFFSRVIWVVFYNAFHGCEISKVADIAELYFARLVVIGTEQYRGRCQRIVKNILLEVNDHNMPYCFAFY